MEEERFMDDNNSLDMSLYTTQSKATVRYPPRLLNHHSYEDYEDDDDSDDGISWAPTEFTTEVALNRYARLGGSWTPPSPLYRTPPATDRGAITPTSLPTHGEEQEDEKPLTPTTDPLSGSLSPPDDDDDDSLAASSSSSSDCEQTTYSLLPATAKMARLIHRGVMAQEQQQKQPSPETPLIRNTSSLEANVSSKGMDEEPERKVSTPRQRQRQHRYIGPVDLDESVTDSSSRASSSHSLTSTLSPDQAYRRPYQSVDARVEQMYGLSDARSRRSAKDDDSSGFSAADNSSATGLPPQSLGGSSIQSPPGSRMFDHGESPGSATDSTLESRSWVQRQTIPGFGDDATTQSSIRDDDTYGFSVASPQKSVETTETNGAPPRDQVRRVELFRQWEEDSYECSNESILSKSRAITSPLHQFYDNDESTILSSTGSPAKSPFAGSTSPPKNTGSDRDGRSEKMEIVAMKPSVVSSIHTPQEKRSVASSIHSPMEESRPTSLKSIAEPADDESLEHLISSSLARPKTLRRLQQNVSDSSVSRSSSVSTPVKAPSPKMTAKAPTPPTSVQSRSPVKLVDQSVMSEPQRTFPRPPSQTILSRLPDSQVQKIEAVPVPSVKSYSWNRHDERHAVNRHAVPSNAVGTSSQAARQAPSLVVDSERCGLTVVSALTPAAVEPMDDDTYGFSTSSPAPIPTMADDDTLGFGSLAGSLLLEEDRDYVWTDQQDENDEERNRAIIQQHIASELLNQTYKQTMDTLSVARRSNESGIVRDDDGDNPTTALNTSGTLLLTETELQKHLKKAGRAEPLPSSEIEGFDAWKRQRERQQRHFAKLQAKHAKDRRQPAQGQRSNATVEQRQHTNQLILRQPGNSFDHGDKCMDSTRSAMDRSMDSSIPTLDDGKWKPRKNFWLRGLGWFQTGKKDAKKKKKAAKSFSYDKGSATSHSDKIKTPKKDNSKRETAILPLSQFMRISADEAEGLADFSLAPMHKYGIMTLGTTTLPDESDTVAGTKSHALDSVGAGPRHLVAHFLEEERAKQYKAQIGKSMDDDVQRELIARRRQEAIEQQRRVNVQKEKPPKPELNPASPDNVSRSSDMNRKKQGPDSKQNAEKRSIISRSAKSREDNQSISVSSKQSVDSSMKSGMLLSPCVLCNDAERSHIAMPCMHFYFCANCVERLYEAESPVCPVCSTANVAFARVYTG